jgi:hypothetical protein
MLRLFVKYFVKMAWQHILYRYVVLIAGMLILLVIFLTFQSRFTRFQSSCDNQLRSHNCLNIQNYRFHTIRSYLIDIVWFWCYEMTASVRKTCNRLLFFRFPWEVFLRYRNNRIFRLWSSYAKGRWHWGLLNYRTSFLGMWTALTSPIACRG